MAYLDTKMQKVLQRMNDVRVEFEQATTTIAHYQELCNRYHDNSLFLFQLLAEAIAQISRLKKELGSQQPVIVVKQESQQPVVEKQEEPPLPVVVPICEKIDGYEKQIAVLEATIRELQAREATERLQEKAATQVQQEKAATQAQQEKAATQAQQEKAATQTSQEKATVVEDESIKSRKQSQWSQ